MHQPLTPLILALFISLGLSACGGGGGDGAGVVGTTFTVNNSVTNASVVIPTPTYAVGSAELGAWNVLQTARKLCGFGTLTQNSKLDAAELAHARYLSTESMTTGLSLLSHFESGTVANNIYFTGINPWDRSQAQGYGTQVAEILSSTTWSYDIGNPPAFPTLEQRGGSSMRSLLNTVYHLSGAMYLGTDVGFGASIQTAVSGTSRREEFRFGSMNGYQTQTIALGAGKVVTYPCQGSSNIPSSFAPADESPNPFPAYTQSTQKVGPPIYLKADSRQTLLLTSYSITTGATNVAATVLTSANDPQAKITSNEIFVIPNSPLAPSTNYSVTLNGTINGTAFTRSFTMTTGL